MDGWGFLFTWYLIGRALCIWPKCISIKTADGLRYLHCSYVKSIMSPDSENLLCSKLHPEVLAGQQKPLAGQQKPLCPETLDAPAPFPCVLVDYARCLRCSAAGPLALCEQRVLWEWFGCRNPTGWRCLCSWASSSEEHTRLQRLQRCRGSWRRDWRRSQRCIREPMGSL